MNISLSSNSQHVIEQQLATGQYVSASEVIDHALLRLSLHQPKTREQLLARLRESRRQLDEGEFIEMDQVNLTEYRDEVKSLVRRAANQGNIK